MKLINLGKSIVTIGVMGSLFFSLSAFATGTGASDAMSAAQKEAAIEKIRDEANNANLLVSHDLDIGNALRKANVPWDQAMAAYNSDINIINSAASKIADIQKRPMLVESDPAGTPTNQTGPATHPDNNATDADRQAAKDKAMIEYVQSQVKNGVDGKNGTNGINGTNGLTTTETKLDTATQARVSTNANNIFLNTERAENNTRMIQANSQSIDKLNNAFSALKDEVNNNQKEANAGISGAMAMSNIPQVMNNQTVAIGAGIGGYEGENALAVGASTRIGNTVVVKATVSDDTENNVGYGAGLSVGW